MSKKNEEKILDELRKRVIAKDRQLEEREDSENLVKSNKEALTEMTDLPRSEVDRIEKEIRAEYQEKARKSKIYRNWTIFTLIIIAIIAFFQLTKEPSYHFIENFDNNANAWNIYNVFELKNTIQDGAYTFASNNNDKCFLDNIDVDLPNSYSIELSSKWKIGQFSPYGLILLENDSNYFTFNLRADGFSKELLIIKQKYETENLWEKGEFSNKNIIVQRVDITDETYKYYIDEKLITKGKLKNLNAKKIGMRVCGQQTVSFLKLEIKNLETGELILSDNFEEKSKRWHEEDIFTIKSKIENGEYVFSCRDEGQCYWALTVPTIKLPIAGESKYTIKLKAKWLSGEDSNFGFSLMEDKDNYINFDIKSSGNARTVVDETHEIAVVSGYLHFGVISDGENTLNIRIEIEDYNYKFFINNNLTKTGDFNGINISHIGLRVCGRQSVAFDELEIIEN